MGDGTLRPAPAHGKGDVSLIINIDKWGFKDAMSYDEPRVVVSVRDENGKAVEAVQVRVVRATMPGSTAWSQGSSTRPGGNRATKDVGCNESWRAVSLLVMPQHSRSNGQAPTPRAPLLLAGHYPCAYECGEWGQLAGRGKTGTVDSKPRVRT